MYSWFFTILYNYFQSKKNYDSFFNSFALVAFSQVVHFCLLILIILNLLGFDYTNLSEKYTINKIAIFPFAFIWLYFNEKYFKKKLNNKSILNNGKIFKLKKIILLIFLFVFLPLYLLIRLSSK